MKIYAPLFLFLIVAVIGYASGLGLEVLVEGEMAKVHQFVFASHYTFYSVNPLIKSAEMSSSLQSIIDSASIGWGIKPLLIDEQGEKFFKNIVNECKFHSPESIKGFDFPDDNIDDGICLVCKILGEPGPCVQDIWLDFAEDEFIENKWDPMFTDDINTQFGILGFDVTVSAVAATSGEPNQVAIFDPLIAHGQGDPDIEHTSVGGDCPDCTGFRIMIIAEGKDDINPPNSTPEVPLDDSADGGTIFFKFGSPKKVVSFDFVDGDRPNNPPGTDFASAYSDVDCTAGNEIATALIDMTAGDGSVQTVTLNANNALCLEIHFLDSGGVTNLHFECPDIILGRGQLDLPNGYDGSETVIIPIPDEEMVKVGWLGGVQIFIQSVILDFTGLADGEVLSDQYFDDFDIWIEGKACPFGNCDVSDLVDRPLQVYNTNPPNGADPDLEVGLGNISIIPHDDNNNGVPDLPSNDSPHGGEQRFIFHTPRHVNSMIFVDADRGSNGNVIGDVTTYGNTDCTSNQIGSPIDIISLGDGSTQILVTMNTDKVQCLKVAYRDSGGVASINLGCPLSTDPVH